MGFIDTTITLAELEQVVGEARATIQPGGLVSDSDVMSWINHLAKHEMSLGIDPVVKGTDLFLDALYFGMKIQEKRQEATCKSCAPHVNINTDELVEKLTTVIDVAMNEIASHRAALDQLRRDDAKAIANLFHANDIRGTLYSTSGRGVVVFL